MYFSVYLFCAVWLFSSVNLLYFNIKIMLWSGLHIRCKTNMLLTICVTSINVKLFIGIISNWHSCAFFTKDLREQIDKMQEQTRKLKKAVKIYSKRLKMSEGQCFYF